MVLIMFATPKVEGERWTAFPSVWPVLQPRYRPYGALNFASYFRNVALNIFRGSHAAYSRASAFISGNQHSRLLFRIPEPNVLIPLILPFWRGYVDGDKRTEAGGQSVTTL
jgi:hypothetical protein